MKIEGKIAEVSVSGVEVSMDYQVASNAKMMRMLSDQLYSNKVKAVIRELSTNSWDATVEANNTVKVPLICLPSRDNLTFSIRDYGTGMSRDAMEKMYRRYGISTKTDSNDYNGQMGIGSKSPFAYTGSFTTISYYNGIKLIYINAKGEDGRPALHFMEESETSEPNGLEISFAVDVKDLTKFQHEVVEVLRWLPKGFELENFINGRGKTFSIKDNSLEYLDLTIIDNSNWKVRKNSTGSKAIMGYVEYPIDPKAFTKDKMDLELSDKIEEDWYQHYGETNYSTLLGADLELHFDIGEIEMDISRESLSYTDATTKAIKDRLDEIWRSVHDASGKLFEDCKTRWEASVRLSNMRSEGSSKFNKLLLNKNTTKWKGEKIPTLIYSSADITGKLGFYITKMYWGNKRWNAPKKVNKEVSPNDFNVKSNILFYEKDVNIGAYSNITYMLEQQAFNIVSKDTDEIYLLTLDNSHKECDLITEGEMRESAAYHLGVDVSDIKKASSLPKAPRKKRDGLGVVLDKVFTLKLNAADYYRRDSWESAQVDFNKGGVYIEINNYATINNSGEGHSKIDPQDLKTMLKKFKKLGIRIPVVYGVKSAVVKRYDKSIKWIDLYTWMRNKLDVSFDKNDMRNKIFRVKEISHIEDTIAQLPKLVNRSSESIKNKDVLSLSTRIDESFKEKRLGRNSFVKLFGNFDLIGYNHGRSFDESKSQLLLDVKDFENKFECAPILLDRYRYRSEDSEGDRIVRYINLVSDSFNKGN